MPEKKSKGKAAKATGQASLASGRAVKTASTAALKTTKRIAAKPAKRATKPKAPTLKQIEKKVTDTAENLVDWQDIDTNRVTAAISYVWILALIPLLTCKDSKFVQGHAKQGLILFALSFFSWFPFFGWILFFAIIIVSVTGIIKALNGENWEIPFVYEWSKKLKF